MLLAGCGKSVDPATLKIREQFLTESPMGSEKPIPKIRDALKSGELKSDSSFTVRVRINAGGVPPFAPGKATFIVTDATGHDGDESHNPHECPFCKRDIKTMIAQVEWHDKDGKLLQVDSRELFDVKEFDLLVIEGTGKFSEDDTLVINASKLLVNR
jgi:hypothetical protein